MDIYADIMGFKNGSPPYFSKYHDLFEINRIIEDKSDTTTINKIA